MNSKTIFETGKVSRVNLPPNLETTLPFYYVNKIPDKDGYHDVHVDDGSCKKPPAFKDRLALGFHLSGLQAVHCARKHYFSDADGCKICVAGCHTRLRKSSSTPKKRLRYG